MTIYDFEKNGIKKYFHNELGITLEDAPDTGFDTTFKVKQGKPGIGRKEIADGCAGFYRGEGYSVPPVLDAKENPIRFSKGTRVGRNISIYLDKKSGNFSLIIQTIRC